MNDDEKSELFSDAHKLLMNAAVDFADTLDLCRQVELVVAVGTPAGRWNITAKLEPKEH